jgi:hypothetical protein
MMEKELVVCGCKDYHLCIYHQEFFKESEWKMNTAAQNSTLVNRIRTLWTSVTTMDPATVRMLETTHVDVRRISRVWGV